MSINKVNTRRLLHVIGALVVALMLVGCRSAVEESKTTSPASNLTQPNNTAVPSSPTPEVDKGGWVIGNYFEAQEIMSKIRDQVFSKCDDTRHFTVLLYSGQSHFLEVENVTVYVIPELRTYEDSRNFIDWKGRGYISWDIEREEPTTTNFNPLSYRPGQTSGVDLIKQNGKWSDYNKLLEYIRLESWDCDDVRKSYVWKIPRRGQQ